MKKLLLIAKNTYLRRVRSGNFLLLTFGLPALMIVAGAVPILREVRTGLPRLGVVDQTGRLRRPGGFEYPGGTLTIEELGDEAAANQAYQRGEIDAYLVVPEDYFEGGVPTLYARESATESLKEALRRYLRWASLPEAPGWLLDRLENPANLRYRALETGAAVTGGLGRLLWAATPAALGIIFALSVFTGANQLGSVVVREKDQRAMEIVITSIRPRTLVAGKVLGTTLVSLTQLAIWIGGGAGGLALALSGSLGSSGVPLRWDAFLWALLLGVPGYFLYATIAAGLGVIAGDQAQARQLAGMLGFLGMSPFYLAGVVVGAPNGALAVALTLFPLSAPTFGLMRMTLTAVPAWQLSLAVGLILLSLALGMWAVSRIFRAAMLLYGQRLAPKEIWRALLQAA
jgi:ABC-2 type transport system permease protein